MYFSEQALTDIRRNLGLVPAKYSSLERRYLHHAFREERAKEFARHGFVRRLNTLARCIENVFSLIPPEREEPVEREARIDAEINIQASVFNVFAAADNLAWIWVFERNVRRADGSELPQSRVGLRRNNEAVRDSLPADVRFAIERFDDWFDMVDDYRHALAHRIPLYIPPYCVAPENEAAHEQFAQRRLAALAKGDLVEHDQLQAEQKTMEFFRPLMLHSLGEGARPLVFHPQLIANFNTIEELGRIVIEALER